MLSSSEPLSSTATTSSSNCRQYRRRRTRRTHYHPSPSSGLLSLLATVVSSTSVNASPVVLPFLCPGVEDKYSYSKREGPASETVDAQSARPKGRRRRLPDRYVKGSDGLWRKADWSLYGSSMCVDCPESTSSTSVPTADADDTVNTGTATATTTTSTAAASTTSLDDFINSLPPGWKPITDSDHTAMILTISLSLAFFICLVMIFCVIWRRGKKRVKDAEKHARRRNPTADDLEVMLEKEKEMKTKKKVLARATARWKANARYTFRQRRTKRKTIHHTDTDADIPATNTEFQSPLSSPLPSRRSSHESISTGNLDSYVEQATLTTSGELTFPLSSSPPAYLRHPPSTNDHSNHNLPSSGKVTPSTSHAAQSCRESVSSLTQDALSINHPLPYSSSHHMAHVATDDKALLERLNQLISAPDGSGLSNSYHTSTFAPVWQDEELSDFPALEAPRQESTGPVDDYNHASSYPSHNGGNMMFPPPPVLSLSSNGKGKGLATYPYPYHSDRSYESSFEYEQDILDIEPAAGPSAPPFEPTAGTFDAGPSAPPFELSDVSIPGHPTAPHFLTPNDAEGDSAAVGIIEANGQISSTTEFARFSENSVRASRACVSIVSTGESLTDGLPASNIVRDPDGRISQSSRST